MKTKYPEAVYRGIWPGFGRIYDIKVEAGHTTIIVKPGEDLKLLAKQTQEKYARKEISNPGSIRSI